MTAHALGWNVLRMDSKTGIVVTRGGAHRRSSPRVAHASFFCAVDLETDAIRATNSANSVGIRVQSARKPVKVGTVELGPIAPAGVGLGSPIACPFVGDLLAVAYDERKRTAFFPLRTWHGSGPVRDTALAFDACPVLPGCDGPRGQRVHV
jgi:hypothetical protein